MLMDSQVVAPSVLCQRTSFIGLQNAVDTFWQNVHKTCLTIRLEVYIAVFTRDTFT